MQIVVGRLSEIVRSHRKWCAFGQSRCSWICREHACWRTLGVRQVSYDSPNAFAAVVTCGISYK